MQSKEVLKHFERRLDIETWPALLFGLYAMVDDQLDNKWIKSIAEHFVNRKIVSVKIMSDEEMDNCFGEDCWHARAVAFKLDNGHWFYPSQDDEGNGAGAIFTTMKKLPVVPVMH